MQQIANRSSEAPTPPVLCQKGEGKNTPFRDRDIVDNVEKRENAPCGSVLRKVSRTTPRSHGQLNYNFRPIPLYLSSTARVCVCVVSTYTPPTPPPPSTDSVILRAQPGRSTPCSFCAVLYSVDKRTPSPLAAWPRSTCLSCQTATNLETHFSFFLSIVHTTRLGLCPRISSSTTVVPRLQSCTHQDIRVCAA